MESTRAPVTIERDAASTSVWAVGIWLPFASVPVNREIAEQGSGHLEHRAGFAVRGIDPGLLWSDLRRFLSCPRLDLVQTVGQPRASGMRHGNAR